MKHAAKKLSETKTQLVITLNAADLAPIQQKTIARLAKKVKTAGFRPGKVPAEVAAKQLDKNYVHQQALEEAVNETAIKAIDAEKIMPLDKPKVEVTKYVPGQELEYTAEIEVVPAVLLGDYKKLKAKKGQISINDKDIDEVIERLQVSMAVKADVDRPAKNGDEVVIDFEGIDKDGKEVPGASGKDYPITLGSNTFIPGFEEGLVGKKAGEVLELPLTFPKDYHHKPLAGVLVTFTVTIKSVKGVEKPSLDDEFAAKAGPFKTLAALKADVTRELTDQKEREAVDKMKDALVEQLVKGSHVPAPEVLVSDQIASIERDFTQNLMYRGMTLDQYLEQQGTTKESWQNSVLRDQAVRRVQVGLVLAELSKAEGIEVSREELEQRLQEMVQRYGNAPDVTKQLDTSETRRDIANRMLTEKTVDRLVELNTK